MEDFDWNEQAKRLLKSELVRRGISNDELVCRLQAIGCKNFVPEVETLEMVVAEPRTVYKAKSKSKKSAR